MTLPTLASLPSSHYAPYHHSPSSTNSDEGRSCSAQRGHQQQQSASRGGRRQNTQSSSDTESAAEPVIRGQSKKKSPFACHFWWLFSDLFRKREYTPAEEKIQTAGRGFGVFYEMWRPYSLIIERGLNASAADPSTLPEVWVFPIHHHILILTSKQRPGICQCLSQPPHFLTDCEG